MDIRELKDSRDREACERAQRSESVHTLRKRDDFNRQVVAKAKPIGNYDDMAEAEFQGTPRGRRTDMPKDYNLRFGHGQKLDRD